MFGKIITSAVLATLMLGSSPAAANEVAIASDVGQVVLPLLAGVCAIRQQRGPDFLAGLVAQTAIVQGLKRGLGDAAINQRPNGGSQGFPSGHTAAAFYGATNLARKCFPDRPALGALAYAAAIAVGVARVQSDNHDTLQVGIGAVIGYYANGVTFSASSGHVGIGYTLKF